MTKNNTYYINYIKLNENKTKQKKAQRKITFLVYDNQIISIFRAV